MKPFLLLIGLCAALGSCAQHPRQRPVADQAPARAASPHRVRRVAAATHVKPATTTSVAKAAAPAAPAPPCPDAPSGQISDARSQELFAQFDNRERGEPAAPAVAASVSQACP